MDSGVFPCDQCTATFHRAKKLEVHIAWRHGKRSFHCKQCELGFGSFSQLIQHQKSHKKSHTCSFCGKTFSMAASLKLHLRSHGKKKEKHPYDVCGMEFRSKRSLLSHLKIHTQSSIESVLSPHGNSSSDGTVQIKRNKHQCRNRHKSFVRKIELRTHEEKKHSPVSIVKRDKLPQSKLPADAYDPHGIKVQCESAPNYWLEDGADVSSDGGVDEDESISDVLYSKKETSFGHTCPFCGAYFNSQSNLDEHITDHSNKHLSKPTRGNPIRLKLLKEVRLKNSGEEIHPKLSSEPKETTVDIDEHSDTTDSETEEYLQRISRDNVVSKKSMNDFFESSEQPDSETEESLQKISRDNVVSKKSMKDFFESSEQPDSETEESLQKISRDNVVSKKSINDFFESSKQLAAHQRDITKKTYGCGACNLVFLNREESKAHMKEQHNKDIYECEICYELFLYERDLHEHKATHLWVKCEHCQVAHSSAIELDWHRIVEHGAEFVLECSLCVLAILQRKITKSLACNQTETKVESVELLVGPYHCDHCPEWFESLTDFREHLRKIMNWDPLKRSSCPDLLSSLTHQKEHEQTHHGRKKKQRVHKCSQCEETFKTLNQKIYHVKKKHEATYKKERPYECSVCPKAYKDHASKERHELTHSEQYKCSFCDKYLSTLNRKKSHEVTCSRTYNCSFCDKIFSKLHRKKHHELIHHTGEKTFKCEFCPKVFHTDSIRKDHQAKHEKKHMCCYCSKRFAHRYLMQIHERTHTGEKPYKCPQCPKAFIYSTTRQLHMLKHSDKRDYICHMCSKAFKTGTALRIHMRTHEHPYKCTSCPSTFKTEARLEYHMKKIHGEMWVKWDTLSEVPIPEGTGVVEIICSTQN